MEALTQKLTGLRSRPFGCSLISWLEWVRVVKGGGGEWGGGSASGGIVSRGLPAPNDFPPLCQRKKGGKEKSEETRMEIVSISLSTSKNLLPLSALIRNHGILSFLATLTKQDHLRMNDSTRSNNHFWSIDLFRSMIWSSRKIDQVRDSRWIVIG